MLLNPMALFSKEPPGFDSQDSEILIIDGPGDTTVRPPPQHLLPFLLAERERLTRLQELMNQSLSPDKPPTGSGRNSSNQG